MMEAENAGGYPARVMDGIMIVATVAASAGPEPDIPPIMRHTSTATSANPPRLGPTMACANTTSRCATPERSNTTPVSTKSGMAISGYLAIDA